MRAPGVVAGVPVHDSERFLPETLEAIAAQDHPNLTIVISDDASTDSTPRLCEEFARSDSRVRLVHQPKRLGWIGNFNALLQYATEDYFLWVPHDDLFDPSYVSALVALLESRPDAALAYAATDRINATGRPIGAWLGANHMDYSGPRWRRALRYMWWTEGVKGVPIRGVMRSAPLRETGGLRSIGYAADDVLLFQMAVRGAFAFDPRPLCRKRLYPGSTAHSYPTDDDAWKQYLRAYAEGVSDSDLPWLEARVLGAAARARELRLTWGTAALNAVRRPLGIPIRTRE